MGPGNSRTAKILTFQGPGTAHPIQFSVLCRCSAAPCLWHIELAHYAQVLCTHVGFEKGVLAIARHYPLLWNKPNTMVA